MTKNKTPDANGVKVVFKGRLMLSGEDGHTLYLAQHGYLEDSPLVERIKGYLWPAGEFASVRYATASTPIDEGKFIDLEIRTSLGETEAKYYERYSDLTGYLWTDEELKVGGHDLLNELKTYADQYLYLEITFYKQLPPGLKG